jgi:tetratricopeptide (TPR) repeat protein
MSRPERVVRWRRMEGAQPSRSIGGSRLAPAAVAVAGGALAFSAVFFGGSSGDGSVIWVGGGTVVLAALVFCAAGFGVVPLPVIDASARLAVAGLTGLVAWAGVSIVWSIAGDQSWSVLNKGIAYVGFLAAGLALAALGTNTTRRVASLLALVIGAALVWALAGKAIPGLSASDASRVARLHSPVGYWNALALLADAALALGAWLAVGAFRRRELRAAGAALVYVAVLAGLLTSSRAGVLGGLLALGLWLRLGNRRVESASVVVLAAVPAVAIAGWAFTRPALVDIGRTHAERVHDGAIFGVLAIAGLAIAIAGPPLLVPRLVTGRERLVGRTLVAGALAAIVIGLAAVAVVSGDPFTKALHGFSRGECTNTADRFTCTNNNRLKWWREAADVFWARPAGGAGAGTFEIARKRYRRSGAPVSEPHSVPLQVLAGTGIVGGVLLALFVGGATVAARRTLRRLEEPDERTAAVALAALPLAYSLHALVDYDIDFLAVTGPALLATGVLLGAGRPLARASGGVVPTLATVAVAATAVVALAMPWLAVRRVDASYSAADAGRLEQAAADARSARSLNPLSPEPLYALALADQQTGDTAGAQAAYVRATEMQPENPETWYRLGLFEFIHADMCAAYQALNHSYTLDPKNTHWISGGELDTAADAVNDPVNPACGRA